MKRMSDVFELPLDCDYFAVDGYQPIKDLSIDNQLEADKYAANAINHVDSLADALEALTSDYVSYRAINDIDLTDDHSAKLDAKMNAAIAALAAYREGL